jgi:type II secretory pathway pseudopilin PulG
LIEVVIAMAILALGLVAALSMSAMSKRRIDKAHKRWRAQHMLAQASEYFLLTEQDSAIPGEFFPYDNVSASCEITEPEFSDDIDPESGNWALKTFNIKINSDDGSIQEGVAVDKIIKLERGR